MIPIVSIKTAHNWLGTAALRLALACLPVLALTSACDWILGTPGPQAGRIALDSDIGARVTILVSTEFLASPTATGDSTAVQLLVADTLRRPLPYDTTYDISEAQRLFVRVLDADSTESTVRMRVWIDGAQKYDQTSTLLEQKLQFIYLFNRILGDEVLLL